MNVRILNEFDTALNKLADAIRPLEGIDAIARISVSSMGLCYVEVGDETVFVGSISECAEYLNSKQPITTVRWEAE